MASLREWSNRTPVRILVIDDYHTHAESLVELLEALGHEALYAPTYSEAEWFLDLFQFDLAILDFDMPEMSGPAMARRFTVRNPKMQSVIVSAHSPQDERLKELGELLFLPKPLKSAALSDLLESVRILQTGLPLVLRQAFPLKKYD